MKRSALTVIATIVYLLWSVVAIAAASPLDSLPGRWSGWGSVTFSGGEKERIKCIATYFLKSGGKSLQQNLRCSTSSSFKINARSNIHLSGSSLKGSWEERKSGSIGSVTGRLTPEGYKLSVKGDAFTAKLRVTVSECKQTVRILPSGLGVKRIAIRLGKC